MIEYLEIINKIKDIKEDAITEFNEKVSIPLVVSNLNSVIKQEDKSIIIENSKNRIELDIETRKSFFEILCILKKINTELYKKIDFKYIDFFEKFKFNNSEFSFENEKIEDIEFSVLTLQILTMLNIKFWCETDDERKEFLENMKYKPVIKDYEKKIETNIIENTNNSIELKEERLDIAKNSWWINFLNKFRKLKKSE